MIYILIALVFIASLSYLYIKLVSLDAIGE